MDDAVPGATAPIPRDLLGAGAPAFVAALRGVIDAPALADFAAEWHADARPASRALLFDYLDQPPNAPGHEGLIKRLFKRAEAAGDDEVMARFLVLTDRLIVRERKIEFSRQARWFRSPQEAQAQAARWIAEGWEVAEKRVRASVHHLTGRRTFRVTTSTRGATLPRGEEALAALTDEERARRRWFGVATRRHLQRRAWRYFRRLGRAEPGRYLAAAEVVLGLYRDDELADGFALLDHQGLMRLLFGTSRAVRFRGAGCDLAIGHGLAELAPSPAFGSIWADHPAAVVRVLAQARAAVVARWAVRWIEADRARFLDSTAPDAWVGLLDRADPAVAGLATGMLGDLPVDRLRSAVAVDAGVRAGAGSTPAHRGVACDLAGRVVEPAVVPRADAIRLAGHAAEPVARLGWRWLREQAPADAAAVPALFSLVDAGCPALRRAILGWVGDQAREPSSRAGWTRVLATSRHADARGLGLARLDDGAADPTLWADLVGSPYPDVRAWCATRVAPPEGSEPARRDRAWAAVLLTPGGMARIKPATIRRVVARLDELAEDDAEAIDLIALLADAARSPRAPERHAALAALVGLATRRPAWEARIAGAVPALQIGD